MQVGRRVINISVSKALENEITRLAKLEKKTKSELLREAFNIYKFTKRWTKLRQLGQLTAEKFNLESFDEIENFAK